MIIDFLRTCSPSSKQCNLIISVYPTRSRESEARVSTRRIDRDVWSRRRSCPDYRVTQELLVLFTFVCFSVCFSVPFPLLLSNSHHRPHTLGIGPQLCLSLQSSECSLIHHFSIQALDRVATSLFLTSASLVTHWTPPQYRLASYTYHTYIITSLLASTNSSIESSNVDYPHPPPWSLRKISRSKLPHLPKALSPYQARRLPCKSPAMSGDYIPSFSLFLRATASTTEEGLSPSSLAPPKSNSPSTKTC
jgi:hypothetical protein